MSNMFITSIKGVTPLKQGYPVLDFHYDSHAFFLDAETEEPIELGTAVMATEVQGTYVAVRDAEVTADNINKVVGFVIGNNATVPSVFPADGPDMVQPGARAEVCVGGAIAVKFVGDSEPEENDEVFIVTASTVKGYTVGDIVDGTEVENVTKIELEGWSFMGISGTDKGVKLTAIHKGF